MNYQTNSMNQRTSGQPNCRSACQKIPRISRRLKLSWIHVAAEWHVPGFRMEVISFKYGG